MGLYTALCVSGYVKKTPVGRIYIIHDPSRNSFILRGNTCHTQQNKPSLQILENIPLSEVVECDEIEVSEVSLTVDESLPVDESFPVVSLPVNESLSVDESLPVVSLQVDESLPKVIEHGSFSYLCKNESHVAGFVNYILNTYPFEDSLYEYKMYQFENTHMDLNRITYEELRELTKTDECMFSQSKLMVPNDKVTISYINVLKISV